MSDINTYADAAAIAALSPINGDLVLNQADSSLYLCINADASGINRWKKFTNDGAAAPVFSNNRLALDFDGSTHLDAGASTDYSLVGGGSFSYWIKPTFTGAPSYMESLSKKSSAGWQVSHAKVGTGYNVLVYNHTFTTSFAKVYLDAENVWYLITGVFHATGGITLYKNDGANGVSGTGLTSSKPAYSFTEDASANLYFGKHPISTTRNFVGVMDEVAFFNTELSETEVADIYNSGVSKDISSYDLSAWWRMGDNDSATSGNPVASISDVSGNGNAATQSDVTLQPTFADLTGETIYS